MVDQGALCLPAVIGFGPALAAVWYVGSRYDGQFSDRRLFALMGVGLILGGVAIVFHLFLDEAFGQGIDLALLGFGLLFPLLETMMKYVVLNLRSLRGQGETAFYGLSLGAGFGAIGVLTVVTRDALSVPGGLWQATLMTQALLRSIGVVGVQATSGLLLGVASARKGDRTRFLQALGLLAAFYLSLLLVGLSGDTSGVALWGSLLVGVALGLGGLVWGIAQVLPQVLDTGTRQRLRRRRLDKVRKMRMDRSRRANRPARAARAPAALATSGRSKGHDDSE